MHTHTHTHTRISEPERLRIVCWSKWETETHCHPSSSSSSSSGKECTFFPRYSSLIWGRELLESTICACVAYVRVHIWIISVESNVCISNLQLKTHGCSFITLSPCI